jgi:LuxR family transcriptional regulator, quorum-sensing system regulator BjaR1
MDTYADLTDALARIRSAKAQTTVWPGVKDFAVRFGYSHLLAVDLTRVAGGLTGGMLHSDAPHVVFEFDRELSPDEHPVVRACLEAPQTFLISELRDAPQSDARWTKFLADDVRNGEGLVVPVHLAGQAVAGANFGGVKPDTSPLTRALLQVVTYAAVGRTFELRDGRSAVVSMLSAREAQCLRQVAVGRSDAEIGQLLGISPRTVRFHVDSAKAKLGVSTRIQAVAKALRERIIAI